MKAINIIVVVIPQLLLYSVNLTKAQGPLEHQITFSFTLSGAAFLGLGYSYYFGNNIWRPNIGLAFMVMRGPPDPVERIYMPFINLVPGIQYNFNEYHNLNGKFWVAYMPTEKPFWGSLIVILSSLVFVIIAGFDGPPIFALPAFLVGIFYLLNWNALNRGKIDPQKI